MVACSLKILRATVLLVKKVGALPKSIFPWVTIIRTSLERTPQTAKKVKYEYEALLHIFSGTRTKEEKNVWHMRQVNSQWTKQVAPFQSLNQIPSKVMSHLPNNMEGRYKKKI